MKNALYVLYDGLTDPLGQSQVLPYLLGLSRSGYRFTILSFEKKERFNHEKDSIQAITAKAGINWVPLFFSSRPPFLAKIYDVWRMRRMALKLQKKHQFHIIHCRSYVAAQIGLIFKKRFETRFLFDMRGFWADEKLDNGQWNLNQFFYRQIYNHYKKLEHSLFIKCRRYYHINRGCKKGIVKPKKICPSFN